MKIPKNATCQNEAERDQTGKIKTMFSICVACERPGANTWRRKICIFCKLEEKPCVENRRITKKTGLTKKNAKTIELCDSSFKHVFTFLLPKRWYLCKVSVFSPYLWLVFAIYI